MFETLQKIKEIPLNLNSNYPAKEEIVKLLPTSQYDITNLGFLPEKCTNILPSGWSHFQPLLDKLSCDSDHEFRDAVHALPPYSPELYSVEKLTKIEKQFLYSVITMGMQKYLWGKGTIAPVDFIPKELGAPLLQISEEFGLYPALTYAGQILFNWALKDDKLPLSLENLKAYQKLSELRSFEWFSIVHVAIEAEGGKVIIPIYNIKQNMRDNDLATIKKTLRSVIDVMKATHVILFRMYEQCTPEDFWTFRFYFEGTDDKNFFPNGLKIKGFEDQPIIVRGASGGQSPLMKIFDTLFSIEHFGHGKEFLDEMKNYMLASHRKFLEDFAKGLSLKSFVDQSEDEELKRIFIEGVDTFTMYRTEHYKLAHDYIFKMVSKKQAEINAEIEKNGDNGLYKQNKNGTGGSNAPKFLKQTIQATKETRIFPPNDQRRWQAQEGLKGNDKIKVKFIFNRSVLENLLLSLIIAIIGGIVIRWIVQ